MRWDRGRSLDVFVSVCIEILILILELCCIASSVGYILCAEIENGVENGKENTHKNIRLVMKITMLHDYTLYQIHDIFSPAGSYILFPAQ